MGLLSACMGGWGGRVRLGPVRGHIVVRGRSVARDGAPIRGLCCVSSVCRHRRLFSDANVVMALGARFGGLGCTFGHWREGLRDFHRGMNEELDEWVRWRRASASASTHPTLHPCLYAKFSRANARSHNFDARLVAHTAPPSDSLETHGDGTCGGGRGHRRRLAACGALCVGSGISGGAAVGRYHWSLRAERSRTDSEPCR